MITKKEALDSLKFIGNIKISEQHGESPIKWSLHSPDYETVLDYIKKQPSVSDKELEETLERLGKYDLYETNAGKCLTVQDKLEFITIKTKIVELEEENKKLDKIREAMKLTYNYGTKEKVYDIIKEVLDNE